jgi:hypothetical protein
MHTESAISRGRTQEGLEKIFATRDLDELRCLTSTNAKRSAYNLMRVNWIFSGKTVEFRQHAGTVDADAVINWIKFVVILVEVAVREEENLRDLLWEEVDREEKQTPVSVYQFMRTFLGCPDVAEYYETRDNVGDTANIIPGS